MRDALGETIADRLRPKLLLLFQQSASALRDDLRKEIRDGLRATQASIAKLDASIAKLETGLEPGVSELHKGVYDLRREFTEIRKDMWKRTFVIVASVILGLGGATLIANVAG